MSGTAKARLHLADRSKTRRKFLVGGRQVEVLRASFLRCVQKHFGQALGNAPKGHGFDQSHQLSEPSPDYGQDFQSDIRILAAELLKVALVDKEGYHRLCYSN